MEVKESSNLFIEKLYSEGKAKFLISHLSRSKTPNEEKCFATKLPKEDKFSNSNNDFLRKHDRFQKENNSVIRRHRSFRCSSSIYPERVRYVSTEEQENEPKSSRTLSEHKEFFLVISQFPVQKIIQLKARIHHAMRTPDSLLALMLILRDVDNSIDFIENKTKMTMKMLKELKNYLSNPGKIVLLLRSLPEYIKSGIVKRSTIKTAKELFKKSFSDDLKDIHRLVFEIIKLYESITAIAIRHRLLTEYTDQSQKIPSLYPRFKHRKKLIAIP